jgi:DNA-directed RNA polymerase sigma subunit (sigma70/sigma32)
MVLADEDAQTPFELLRNKNLRDEVSDLLAILDDRERMIIFQRFGLDGGKPKTLEGVDKNFGVTRERIRHLQNIALAKLRREVAAKAETKSGLRIKGHSFLARLFNLDKATKIMHRAPYPTYEEQGTSLAN